MKQTNKVKQIDMSPWEYMSNSQLNLTGVNSVSTDTAIEIKQYSKKIENSMNFIVHVMRLVDSQRIFVVCHRIGKHCPCGINIFVNNQLTLTSNTTFAYAEILDQSESFNIKIIPDVSDIQPIEHIVSRHSILNNPDYIKFSN